MQSLVGPDGVRAHDYADIRTVFHEHFSATESASDVSLQSVLDIVRRAQDRVRGTFDIAAATVPTLPELEQGFRGANGNRSIGPDGIPDGFFAVFARQLIRVCGPLLYKAFLRLDAPIQFAGGILHMLSKGGGPSDLLDIGDLFCARTHLASACIVP